MKKINKILMIEPKSPDVHIFSLTPVPRLGTIILGTILKERGFDVTVIAEEIHPIKDEYFNDVDLVGISTITSTANKAYSLADKLREKGIIVVMGGPHVTFLPEEAIKHADYVVMGEGEYVFPELVETLDRGEKVKERDGLVIRGEKINYKHAPRVEDLDETPIPDFSIVKGMDSCIVRFKQVIPMQLSRGCPFDCSFCSVTDMFGRKFRHKSIERVLKEVEKYNSKKYSIFFYDDNIAADKNWLKKLLKEFVRRKMKFSWNSQVRIDAAKDEELLDLMAATNCDTVFIGLESVNPEALKEMNKRQTVEEIKEGIKAFTRKKIPVHGMFIFGLDTDTPETIENTVNFAKNSGINTVQFLILTPLPGTKTYRDLKEEKRIFFSDWSFYDGHHVTFIPKNFEPITLQELQLKGHRKFYSFTRLLKKFMTGRFTDAMVYVYARHIDYLWKKSNKIFVNSLDFISRTKDIRETIRYWVEISEETLDKLRDKINTERLKSLLNRLFSSVELIYNLKKLNFKKEEINIILNMAELKTE